MRKLEKIVGFLKRDCQQTKKDLKNFIDIHFRHEQIAGKNPSRFLYFVLYEQESTGYPHYKTIPMDTFLGKLKRAYYWCIYKRYFTERPATQEFVINLKRKEKSL